MRSLVIEDICVCALLKDLLSIENRELGTDFYA